MNRDMRERHRAVGRLKRGRTTGVIMKRGLLVSVCLILITACNPAPEDVASPTAVGLVDIPNATIVYYDVAGSTENELRAQLDALGPVGYDGYKGDSTTQWIMRWSWPGYGSSSCDLSAAEVTYDIRVILPRWKSPENAGPDLVAKWTNYTRQLAEHEKGHVDFVVAHYPSIADAVKAAQCETAEVAAQAALARIRQHDVDYDAATHHGATQGARFP